MLATVASTRLHIVFVPYMLGLLLLERQWQTTVSAAAKPLTAAVAPPLAAATPLHILELCPSWHEVLGSYLLSLVIRRNGCTGLRRRSLPTRRAAWRAAHCVRWTPQQHLLCSLNKPGADWWD